MALEAIGKVTELERNIQKQREDAAAESKQRIQAAQRAGQQLLDESRQQAEAEVRNMMAQAEKKAAEQAKEIMAEAQRSCEALKSSARKKLDQAAALVVKKVVSD